MKNGVETGIGIVERVNKNLGGDKEKENENEKQTISIVGNSNCAVLAVFSGYTCDCC
jgi:hypothetical protein